MGYQYGINTYSRKNQGLFLYSYPEVAAVAAAVAAAALLAVIAAVIALATLSNLTMKKANAMASPISLMIICLSM